MEATDAEPVKAQTERTGKGIDFIREAIRVTGSTVQSEVRRQFYALYPTKHDDSTKDGRIKNDEARKQAFKRGWASYMRLATTEPDDE